MEDLISPDAIYKLSDALAAAYASLRRALAAAQYAARDAAVKRSSLNDARDTIIRIYAPDPKKMGANEAAREAFLRAETTIQTTDAEIADEAQKDAEGAARLAAIDVDAARAQLRIAELAASLYATDRKAGDRYNA